MKIRLFSLFPKSLPRPQPPATNSPHGGLSPEFVEKYGLTKRQAELAAVLLQGKSDREIAALSGIAVNTVQTHLKKIYRKTGARGRCALMALVMKEVIGD